MTRNFVVALVTAVATALATAGSASASATSTLCCLPWQQPGKIVVSPDGQNIYASDNNVAVSVAVDQPTGALTLLDSYDSPGRAAAISPDGRHVYFASPD